MNALQKAEKELMKLSQKVTELRKKSKPTLIRNYIFKTLEGETSLLDLFAGKDTLFLVHNMGQGCRYCTLWADGFNGFIQHIESEYAFALVSKDNPKIQRLFANSRGWRFRMASHGGGKYIQEQSVMAGEKNMPGMVCYIRKGDKIYRKNSAVFGPGDEFCPLWNIISLAGISTDEWVAQFNYWKRPEKVDDGGKDLI